VLLAPGSVPGEPETERFPKMVGVLDTNDNFALASACTALDRAGIVFDVVSVSDVPESLKSPEPKWWIRPSRILVSDGDEAEARQLVEQFQLPDAGDTIDMQGAQDSGRIGGAGVLDRLFPRQTAVQRFGCSLLFATFGLAGLAILVMSRQARGMS
jgi:hypothetical protein